MLSEGFKAFVLNHKSEGDAMAERRSGGRGREIRGG